MLKTTTLSGAVILLPILSFAAAAQAPASKGDWGNLRTLIAGAEIRVMATGHEVIRGAFREVNDDALIVDQPSGEKMLPRSSVISVSLKKPSRRIGYVLIGALQAPSPVCWWTGLPAVAIACRPR